MFQTFHSALFVPNSSRRKPCRGFYHVAFSRFEWVLGLSYSPLLSGFGSGYLCRILQRPTSQAKNRNIASGSSVKSRIPAGSNFKYSTMTIVPAITRTTTRNVILSLRLGGFPPAFLYRQSANAPAIDRAIIKSGIDEPVMERILPR
jgi:hypothetical protein